jgi:hypothetical protein
MYNVEEEYILITHIENNNIYRIEIYVKELGLQCCDD